VCSGVAVGVQIVKITEQVSYEEQRDLAKQLKDKQVTAGDHELTTSPVRHSCWVHVCVHAGNAS